MSSEDRLIPASIKENNLTWGRAQEISYQNRLTCLLLLLLTPFWVSFLWASCTYYNCSVVNIIYDFFASLSEGTLFEFLIKVTPAPTFKGFGLYIFWVLFQALMYMYWPSNIGTGQMTPAGNILSYRVNGLRVWVVTHILFILGASITGLYSMAIIQENWGALLIATNCLGYLLTVFVYFKAYYFPTHKEDCKFSGSTIYDLYMGIEHNPRIGDTFDFKLFFNGRPGIVAWTLINLSFAVAQYKQLGFVTNSMVLLNFLHAIYVVDFFYFEDWYLRTIDIAHDHFGYYLAWGDCVWLPFTYTLQSHYIYRNPESLSWFSFIFVLTIGLVGYYIFRHANNQKDLVRKSDGNINIWGAPARFIRASYTTSDNKVHNSILLTSGFWGISRHFNYIGDLLMCLSFGMACGLQFDFIPYYYLIYMTILLVHRISRDQDRCKAKYGIFWDQYCEAVPYKLIPFIY
ncbi:7-dehydrocholesterol reductase [Smittium culicis]|uniref:7-dehydrocholesterol reductase n=1 Tax=Smittium culicis TaxID=133412 RepID=A0A1R1Y1C3_9FUNG|nr:7-dehydrocholesterol reductase [Smittium culicis]